jgi:hypothetical protein
LPTSDAASIMLNGPVVLIDYSGNSPISAVRFRREGDSRDAPPDGEFATAETGRVGRRTRPGHPLDGRDEHGHDATGNSAPLPPGKMGTKTSARRAVRFCGASPRSARRQLRTARRRYSSRHAPPPAELFGAASLAQRIGHDQRQHSLDFLVTNGRSASKQIRGRATYLAVTVIRQDAGLLLR